VSGKHLKRELELRDIKRVRMQERGNMFASKRDRERERRVCKCNVDSERARERNRQTERWKERK